MCDNSGIKLSQHLGQENVFDKQILNDFTIFCWATWQLENLYVQKNRTTFQICHLTLILLTWRIW